MVKRNSSRRFSEDARKRLGTAHRRARQAAGYPHRPAYATATGVALRSIVSLERGDPVGEYILEAVGRFLPGWSEDTAWRILEGDPIPEPAAVAAPPDEPQAGLGDDPLEDVDEGALLRVVTDRSKLGTDEHLEALGILFARDLIPRDVYAYGLVVNRKVRKARESVDREIADLQRSLTERVQSDLSG